MSALAAVSVVTAVTAVPSAGAVARSSMPAAASAVATTSVATTSVTTTSPVASSVAPLSAADLRMRTLLTRRATTAVFGTQFSGSVIDVASDRNVWSKRGDTLRRPASTTKLVTATNVLSLYGPDYRITTTVRQGSTASSVVLVGAGDPTLSSADLTVLARATAARVTGRGVRTVRVWADDYLFARASLARGWKPGYVPTDVRWVRALVVDQRHARDTALDAASVFAAQLRAAGVRVASVGRAKAPAGSPVLASSQGDRMDSIVADMLLSSNNDHAEALHRLVALRAGQPRTWTGAHVAQQAVLAREGVRIGTGQLWDGSGLSRNDFLSARQLARVVDHAFSADQPELAVLRGAGLPVSGRTGTLSTSFGRFSVAPTSCARGRIHAKTGTLDDAVALAGWTVARDGRRKAFAFLVNGKGDSLALKRSVDRLAATITGCY